MAKSQALDLFATLMKFSVTSLFSYLASRSLTLPPVMPDSSTVVVVFVFYEFVTAIVASLKSSYKALSSADTVDESDVDVLVSAAALVVSSNYF